MRKPGSHNLINPPTSLIKSQHLEQDMHYLTFYSQPYNSCLLLSTQHPSHNKIWNSFAVNCCKMKWVAAAIESLQIVWYSTEYNFITKLLCKLNFVKRHHGFRLCLLCDWSSLQRSSPECHEKENKSCRWLLSPTKKKALIIRSGSSSSHANPFYCSSFTVAKFPDQAKN